MVKLIKKYKINRDRPTIGVTGPNKGGGAAWFFTALSVRLIKNHDLHLYPLT